MLGIAGEKSSVVGKSRFLRKEIAVGEGCVYTNKLLAVVTSRVERRYLRVVVDAFFDEECVGTFMGLVVANRFWVKALW